MAFTVVHVVRAARLREPVKHSSWLTEVAGLPITLMHTVCFVWAAFLLDVPAMLLFLWWGPGLVATFAVIAIKGKNVRWKPHATWISWACKLWYLAFMVAFWRLGIPAMMFAFSVWILNDQVEKAFLSWDSDRTRRTFHDGWLFRVLYPAFLFVPLFDPRMPFRAIFAAYGVVLFVLWVAGLIHVWRKGLFLKLPDDPALLRNIVYLK